MADAPLPKGTFITRVYLVRHGETDDDKKLENFGRLHADQIKLDAFQPPPSRDGPPDDVSDTDSIPDVNKPPSPTGQPETEPIKHKYPVFSKDILNAHGEDQAVHVANSLNLKDVKFDFAYSSSAASDVSVRACLAASELQTELAS